MFRIGSATADSREVLEHGSSILKHIRRWQVVGALSGAEGLEQRPDPSPGGIDGLLGGLAQQSFELSEELFDRIEVWAEGGRKTLRQAVSNS
jgi:hypothetical protein